MGHVLLATHGERLDGPHLKPRDEDGHGVTGGVKISRFNQAGEKRKILK